MLPPPPRSTLFPYTTLFRSRDRFRSKQRVVKMIVLLFIERTVEVVVPALSVARRAKRKDRKSTRLNSSHTVISYAVFCLKKKKKKKTYEISTTQHDTYNDDS